MPLPMFVSKESLEGLKCTNCNNYLSYFPIKLRPKQEEVICGRCVVPEGDCDIIRNEIYETIAKSLKFPCRYDKKGCLENLYPEEMPDHEKLCPFMSIDCPSKDSGKCVWHGSYADLQQHYEESHQNFVLSDAQFEIDLINTYKHFLLLPYGDDLFIVRKEFDANAQVFSCSVHYIGFTGNVENYAYQLILENGTKTRSIKFSSCPTGGLDKSSITEVVVSNVKERLDDPTAIVGRIEITENDEILPNKPTKHHANVNYEILSVLECPVCFEYIVPPIFQCLGGHSICAWCKNKFSECPSCEREIQGTRNYELEKITGLLMYPCKNHEFGCSYTDKSNKIKEHEKFCIYSLQDCLVKDYENCDSKFTMNVMYPHIKSCHHDNILELDIISIPISKTYFNNEDSLCYILKYSLHLFKLHYLYKEGTFFWAMQLVGSSEECDKFTFEIDVVDNSGGNLRMYIRGPTAPLCHRLDCFKKDGDFISINLNQISHLITDNFTYRVRVLK